MATIGTFTKTENGYNGSIETLSLKANKVTLVPAEKTGEKGPDYRVKSGNAEIGAAWAQTSKKDGKPYLSVKIDDPSFVAAIYANLIEQDGKHALIWSR